MLNPIFIQVHIKYVTHRWPPRYSKLTMATSPIQTKELLDQITGMCDHGDFMEEEQEADLCMGE